jgi:hypothetical protein
MPRTPNAVTLKTPRIPIVRNKRVGNASINRVIQGDTFQNLLRLFLLFFPC